MKRISLLFPAILLFSLGCGEGKQATFGRVSDRVYREAQQLQPPGAEVAKGAAHAEPAPARANQPPAEPVARKIIYTATLDVVVKDFATAEQKLLELVKTYKGFVAQSDISATSGERRSGLWKIRIPVERFEAFLEDVTALGMPRRNATDSKDVTEEYYDVSARVKNKKLEEERLLKHLEKSTGKLEDILAVEKEISRVRGEIEQLEGRLRLLSNLTELTTVTVTLQEIKDYVPPQAPTFGNRLGRTFFNSLDNLKDFGVGVAMFVAALIPWLPVLAVAVLPFWLMIRRARRRRAPAAVVAPDAAPEG